VADALGRSEGWSRATVGDDGEPAYVSLSVLKDDPIIHAVPRVADGQDVVVSDPYRGLHFDVGSAPMAPVRSDVWGFASGAVSVYAGTTNGPVASSPDVRPDGPSDVTVDDTASRSTYGVRVTAEGEVIPEENEGPSATSQHCPRNHRNRVRVYPEY
jgi:hypothetical protein